MDLQKINSFAEGYYLFMIYFIFQYLECFQVPNILKYWHDI